MASASDSVTLSQNWLQGNLILENCLTDALLTILHNKNNDPRYIGLPQDGAQLYACMVAFKNNYQHKLRNVIRRGQWDIICPRSGLSNSSHWDIVILKLVIQYNVLYLLPPIRGWTNPIEPADVTTAADVCRSVSIRNRLKRGTINELANTTYYNSIMTEVEDLLRRLGYQNMKLFNDLKALRLNQENNSFLEHKEGETIEQHKQEIISSGKDLHDIILEAKLELRNILSHLLHIYADVHALTNPSAAGTNALCSLLSSDIDFLKIVVKVYVSGKLYTSRDKTAVLPDVDSKKFDSSLLLDILIKFLLTKYLNGNCSKCGGVCCPDCIHSENSCIRCSNNCRKPTEKCWHKCKNCKKFAKACSGTICCITCNTCLNCNKDIVTAILNDLPPESSPCQMFLLTHSLDLSRLFIQFSDHVTVRECEEFTTGICGHFEIFQICRNLPQLQKYVIFMFNNLVEHAKVKCLQLPFTSSERYGVHETMDRLNFIFKHGISPEKHLKFSKKSMLIEDNHVTKTDLITTFHDSKPQYYDVCERFKKEYKENSTKFLSIDEKGYVYKKDFVIGTGNKCDLFLGYHSNHGWIAIKRCKKIIGNWSKDELKEKIEEIRILVSLNASVENKGDINIIDLLYWTSDEDFYYIITPLYDFTLGKFLETKQNFETRVEILKQLLKVIKRLHSIQDGKLLHKDLKPNNIMIQKNNHGYNVKLIDFGESRHYVPGQTETKENCGDPKWLPPGISIDVDSRFTSIHESFVVCMLAVYILSNGKHPFITSNKAIELKNKYAKIIGNEKEKISIQRNINIASDLVDFFNKKFNEFFPYFRAIKEHKKDEKEGFHKILCVSKIKEELKDVHSYRSLNHTRAHRLLAMLPLNEEGNTIIPTSIPNCSTLLKRVSSLKFTTVDTKSDMTRNDFQEQLTKELNEYKDSRQIYLFLYIVTHSAHDVNSNDVFFRMKVCEKDKMGNIKCSIDPIYIGVLLNEINDSFEKKDLLTIVLLFEGCRKEKVLQTDGTGESKSKPFPKNVVVFYSVKLDQISRIAGNSEDFATLSQFCDKLIDNIKPGKSLKDVFDNTTKALNKVYAIKDEEGKYDIYEEDEPVEYGKKPLYLFKPELFINCNECKKTAKLNCEECKTKLIKDEEGKYDICGEDEPVEDDKEPKPELSINCNECKKKLKFNCGECEKKLSFIF